MAALITRATVDEISKKDLSIYRHEEEKDACEYIQNACVPKLSPLSLHYQCNVKETSNENKEKYQLVNYWLIQFQILQTNIINIRRHIYQTVRRITG